MNHLSPFGERSTTLVAAHYSDPHIAASSARMLSQGVGLDHDAVAVVAPGQGNVAAEMEPDGRGIWKTLVRSHVLLGTAGALIGIGVSCAAIRLSDAAASSPGLTLLFVSTLTTFLGMMTAGLLTLRPDHALAIHRVQRATAAHRWSVVVRPLNAKAARRAVEFLRGRGAEPFRSW